MTPAEILRAAAARVRELAQAAHPGPWAVRYVDGIDAWVESGDYETVVPYTEGLVASDDAAFIAAFHPGVALAVADWLDAEAGFADSLYGGKGHVHALAVARALLPTEEPQT